MKVAVTGATGQISYSFLFRLGEIFGQTSVELALIDLPGTEKMMEGLGMELEDCAFPFIKKINFYTDPRRGFSAVDWAFLVGAKPRSKGMERSDLLIDNAKIFVEQGRALNETAKRETKVIVVGNPCNTNCLIALQSAPDLNPKNFHAMMRLDENRAKAALAKKAKVDVHNVRRMAVWGNHSATQVPDFTHGTISGRKATEVLDKTWLQEEFMKQVQLRGGAIIEARGKSSAASAANALIDATKSLLSATPQDDWFTTAVFSNGNPYGIEEDLVFGFPCRSRGNGDYEIVADLDWDYFIREKIAITQEELIAERECIQKVLHGR